MCFCRIKYHHKVLSLLFCSSTASAVIGEQLFIAARTIKLDPPSFWLNFSQLKAHTCCLSIFRKIVFLYQIWKHKSIFTIIWQYLKLKYYWRMIIYYSKNNKIWSFILLAAFLKIKSALFVCQSYVKMCFEGGNPTKKYFHYFFPVAQHQLL